MATFTTTQNQTQSVVASLFRSVYLQMAAALTITGLTAFFVSHSETLLMMFYANPMMIWLILGAEIGIVIWLSSRLMRMSVGMATILFIAYSVLTGVSLASIFLVYQLGTIASAFFATAGTFLVMSLLGYTTKMDLSKMGNILIMMLIGLIIGTVINIFWANSTLYWIITYAGIIIFTGLVAWDTQNLRRLFEQHGAADDMGQKLAIYGALSLYLDFINLFLYLLRFLGNRD